MAVPKLTLMVNAPRASMPPPQLSYLSNTIPAPVPVPELTYLAKVFPFPESAYSGNARTQFLSNFLCKPPYQLAPESLSSFITFCQLQSPPPKHQPPSSRAPPPQPMHYQLLSGPSPLTNVVCSQLSLMASNSTISLLA